MFPLHTSHLFPFLTFSLQTLSNGVNHSPLIHIIYTLSLYIISYPSNQSSKTEEEKMLDLNISFVHEDMMTDFRDESGSSSSSVLNTEHCNSNNAVNGDGDGVGDGDSFHCFNFDILNVGDTGVSEDRENPTQSQFMTRSLFPMSQVNSSLLLFPDNNSNFQDMELVQVQQQKPIVQQQQQQQNQVTVKKSRRGPRSRSSQYRGVTFYRRTGRWESHIWDCGKQVYLGGFDTAHAAARAYDRAAIKFRGVDADINFNITDYEEDMNQIKNLSKEDFVHLLRRHSNGFLRGKSKYGGVVIDKSGRWEAQMGPFIDKKAYNNTTIKSNFEAGTYERETFASHSGNSHSLDLNLGISTPSCLGKGLSRHPNSGHMQLNHGYHDIRRLHMENMENRTPMTLKGRPIISEHDQPWTSMYPTFFPSYPSYEVGTTNTRIIGGSSQGPSNWAWQLHGQLHPKVTLFTAASSGFPTPAATANISTTTATNSPDYHYPMRPPPSPPPAPPPTP